MIFKSKLESPATIPDLIYKTDTEGYYFTNQFYMHESIFVQGKQTYVHLYKFNISSPYNDDLIKRRYKKIGNIDYVNSIVSYVTNCNLYRETTLCLNGIFENIIITEKDGKYYRVSGYSDEICSELSLATAEDLAKIKEEETILIEEDEISTVIKYKDRSNFIYFQLIEELTSDTTLTGEGLYNDGVKELFAVYKSQIIRITFLNSSRYILYVDNITNSIPERKTLNYTIKFDFEAEKMDEAEKAVDCQKTSTLDVCKDEKSVRVAYSETKIESPYSTYNRTKNFTGLPMEICQKYKERLPNLYELCSTINGVSYSLISSIIVSLLLLI